MTKFICETKNLSKKYKDFYALKNVNLTIPKGEIYGLVGENGAGKTTLIRLLTGLNFKSEGEIILFGHNDNLQYERSKIGCTIEMPALYKDMTASQNLEVQRIQRGIPNKSCIADTLGQHRTIAEASAVESPIRQETIGFPAHFFARAHNFKPPGRACQPEADSPMRT